MSFTGDETSVADGELVELYKWSTSEGDLTETSAIQPIIYNLETYDPRPLTRGTIEVDASEDRPGTLKITVARNHPIALRYIQTIPPQKDSLVIFRGHAEDTPADAQGRIPIDNSQVVQYFEGFITAVTFKNAEAEISVANSNTIFDRTFPKKNFRNLCNHMLYDGGCAVAEGPFEVAVTVSAINGPVLTLDGVPPIGAPTPTPGQLIDDPYYNGGILTQVSSGDTRMVLDMVRTATVDVTLLFPFQSLAVGQALTLIPGCDHTLATCTAKFANSKRYGGFPYVPTDNPFNKRLAD